MLKNSSLRNVTDKPLIVNSPNVHHTSLSGTDYNLYNYIVDSPINIKSYYGAVGDGIHDDTKAIRNALATESHIYFPEGIYFYSGEITGQVWGQILEGESLRVTLRQGLSGANGINLMAGSTPVNQPGGEGILNNVLKNLTFQPVYGNALGNPLGKGINFGNINPDTANGNFITFDNIGIYGFATGMHLKSLGNLSSRAVNIAAYAGSSGDCGVFVEGAGLNSNDFNTFSITRFKSALLFGDGGGRGNVFRPWDFGENGTNFSLTNQSNMILLGGNMDSTYYHHANISGQSSMIAIGQGGASQPSLAHYVLDPYSNLTVINTYAESIAGGDNANAVFLTPGIDANVSGSRGGVWHGLPIPMIYDDSIPIPDKTNRGALLQLIARSGTTNDSIVFLRGKRDGTFDLDNLSNKSLLESVNTFPGQQIFSGSFSGGGIVLYTSLAGSIGDERGALVIRADRDSNPLENVCDIVVRPNTYNQGLNDIVVKNRDGSIVNTVMQLGHGGATGAGCVFFPQAINVQGMAFLYNASLGHSNLAFSTTGVIDFASTAFITENLSGNAMFNTSNLDIGRSVSLRLINDSSTHSLSFPTGWKFVGSSSPTGIAANATAILALTSFGTLDSDVIAAYAVTL